MLKNFKNLKGAQVLSKNEQKAVNGGGACHWEKYMCQLDGRGVWYASNSTFFGECGYCLAVPYHGNTDM
jgi:hypothetical protein